MTRTGLLLLPLIACAACSDAGKPDGGDNRAAAAIENAVAENGAAATAAKGLPVTPPAQARANPRAFPPAFQGYWGIAPADCSLANVDATGRINIDGGTVRFYESRARVATVVRAASDAFVADMGFSGEGQRWTKRIDWTLAVGGTRLIRTDAGAAAITYQRC